jgi:propanol-preferring alcohol dehydrogenase
MRARWIEEWDGPLLDGERPEPELAAGEVLIDVEACGVGQTVLNCIRGDLGSKASDLPRVPGHELVGRVTGVAIGVPEEIIGQRVMAYFHVFCGRCRRCLAGEESLCVCRAGYVGVHRDGGYAAKVALPYRNAVPLPDRSIRWPPRRSRMPLLHQCMSPGWRQLRPKIESR